MASPNASVEKATTARGETADVHEPSKKKSARKATAKKTAAM
ncbi:hypothetical protein [Streptomyces griseosporeus]